MYNSALSRSSFFIHCPGLESVRFILSNLVYKINFYATFFTWKFLFTGVDEENWSMLTWQIYFLKNWRVSSCVTNITCHANEFMEIHHDQSYVYKICHIRRIARVDIKCCKYVREHQVFSGVTALPCFCVSLLSKVITGALNFWTAVPS